ncbi:MAG: hypothetical protein AB1631_13725 [Acidobacteriota bacterium]
MDEQEECRVSAAFSLTPRLIAVKSERLQSETVSTVFPPAQMSVTTVYLMISQRIKERQEETVETVPCHQCASLTAINRGVNERVSCSTI